MDARPDLSLMLHLSQFLEFLSKETKLIENTTSAKICRLLETCLEMLCDLTLAKSLFAQS